MCANSLTAVLFIGTAMGMLGCSSIPTNEANSPPAVTLRRAETIKMPGGWFPEINLNVVDCSSPCWWVGDTFYLLNSAADAWRSYGPDVNNLCPAVRTKYTQPADGYRWIESVYQQLDGTLFGWYHNEPRNFVPEEAQKGRESRLTAPRIGACRSTDNGMTWDDLGIVLEAPAGSWNLQTSNYYFAGGHGDFTVILDPKNEYFYFFFGSYVADVNMQGVAAARLKYSDRNAPAGKVRKYYHGRWSEPGLGGRMSPILPATADWHGKAPDVFWGPNVHYNAHLRQYVMLLNRAIDSKWKQAGIYICFNADISNPGGWTAPKQIVEGGGWYPQVVGIGQGETDRMAGEEARLFIGGTSDAIIEFD